MEYITKQVIINAVQWTGKNVEEIKEFFGENKDYSFENDDLFINTLEGTMLASINDYIIKGLNGEFYPCKPDIFKKKYEIREAEDEKPVENSSFKIIFNNYNFQEEKEAYDGFWCCNCDLLLNFELIERN